MSEARHSSSGFFITFEGGEGAGKTTQTRRLRELLDAHGRTVVLTREPGGTPEAERIRDLLVQRDGGNWTPLAETLLFFTARLMHVEHLIRPAVAAGKVVISDRFTDSTRAYQGYGHGYDRAQIENVKQLVLGDFEPDLTLILDIPVETGLDRSFAQKIKSQGRESTEDRFEKLDRTFHERLRQGFLDIARHNPSRCVVIDATQAPDDIFADIVAVLKVRHVI